jgi:hypothetical protein
MAVTDEHEGDRLGWLVTGVYVSPDLMGVATHGGERTRSLATMRRRQTRTLTWFRNTAPQADEDFV